MALKKIISNFDGITPLVKAQDWDYIDEIEFTMTSLINGDLARYKKMRPVGASTYITDDDHKYYCLKVFFGIVCEHGRCFDTRIIYNRDTNTFRIEILENKVPDKVTKEIVQNVDTIIPSVEPLNLADELAKWFKPKWDELLTEIQAYEDELNNIVI